MGAIDARAHRDDIYAIRERDYLATVEQLADAERSGDGAAIQRATAVADRRWDALLAAFNDARELRGKAPAASPQTDTPARPSA